MQLVSQQTAVRATQRARSRSGDASTRSRRRHKHEEETEPSLSPPSDLVSTKEGSKSQRQRKRRHSRSHGRSRSRSSSSSTPSGSPTNANSRNQNSQGPLSASPYETRFTRKHERQDSWRQCSSDAECEADGENDSEGVASSRASMCDISSVAQQKQSSRKSCCLAESRLRTASSTVFSSLSSAPRAREKLHISIPKPIFKSDWQPHPALQWYVRNQIGLPAAIVAVICAAMFMEDPLATVSSKIALVGHPVYSDTDETRFLGYGKGIQDFAFVAFWFIVLTLARAATQSYVFKPLAKYAAVPPATRTRFAEQGWLALYYFISVCAGICVLANQPHWFDTKQFWIGYPHLTMPADFKAYYLIQAAFWLHQLIVVNIERPRSDYWQFVTHHVVTIVLIAASYFCNFTRIGSAVLLCMDAADVFLSVTKCLMYARYQKIADALFVLFMLVWVVTRHVIFLKIIWSTYTEAEQYLEIKWAPEEGHFATYNTKHFFVSLFVLLQTLMIWWLYLIVRVAYRAVTRSKVSDVRSDSENEDSDGEKNIKAK